MGLKGLTDADVAKIKKLIRESGSVRSSRPLPRRTRRGAGGGKRQTAGTESSLGLCVNDIPAAEVPDLTGMPVQDWEYEVGQAGVAADRITEFGQGGNDPQPYGGEAGVVLVDWLKNYDKQDLSTYFDAAYVSPKEKLAPIVERFGEGITHEGGGLGGGGGGGGGLGGGGGGGDGI